MHWVVNWKLNYLKSIYLLCVEVSYLFVSKVVLHSSFKCAKPSFVILNKSENATDAFHEHKKFILDLTRLSIVTEPYRIHGLPQSIQ